MYLNRDHSTSVQLKKGGGVEDKKVTKMTQGSYIDCHIFCDF